MAAVWQMYGYQDYPASDPPVCAFKVCIGAQLKDFIQRKEVTDLQIYYNQPDVIDSLKYAEFFEKYNTSSELPKYYENNPNAENNVGLDQNYFKVHMDPDQKIQYVYVPVRQVKRCVHIKIALCNQQ